MVNGFVVDPMHCVDLGVVRQVSTMWFESSFHKMPWYIGTKIDSIDEKIKFIQPPSNVTRTPRSLRTRAYWKASEWKHFLLYCIQQLF